MKQSAKITIAAILVIGVFSISILTVPAFADWGKFSYPQIQGTVPVSSGDDFEQKNGIALSVAMQLVRILSRMERRYMPSLQMSTDSWFTRSW